MRKTFDMSYSHSFTDLFDVANIMFETSKVDLYEMNRKLSMKRHIYVAWSARVSSTGRESCKGFFRIVFSVPRGIWSRADLILHEIISARSGTD